MAKYVENRTLGFFPRLFRDGQLFWHKKSAPNPGFGLRGPRVGLGDVMVNLTVHLLITLINKCIVFLSQQILPQSFKDTKN